MRSVIHRIKSLFILLIMASSCGSLLVLGGCSKPTPAKPVIANKSTQVAKKSSAPRAESKSPAVDDVVNNDPPIAKAEIENHSAVGAKPQTVYRPSDTRPKQDDQKLDRLGIKRYESNHLLLYTDIEPDIAKSLPPLIDAVYPHWEKYFGKLPPNREGTVFQLTGYLMTDKELFRRAGLIPIDLPPFPNGRQRGAEFWMVDQKQEYYLRHLLLHEATHGYENFVPVTQRPPVWFQEGIAELFGTHQIDKTDRYEFRVMPGDKRKFRGWGRIRIISDAFEANKALPMDKVLTMPAKAVIDTEQYAWWWALCEFLDEHPRYQKTFRQLGKRKTNSQFQALFKEELLPWIDDLRTEWMLYIQGLDYGYDLKRSAITFKKGAHLTITDQSRQLKITADRGWQSSGVYMEKDQEFQISATGRFLLGSDPKPWISEPQGITFTYYASRPIGTLIAAVRDESGQNPGSMLTTYAIGRETRFVAPFSGTLYLRLNDAFNQLGDNSGHCQVRIQRVDSEK